MSKDDEKIGESVSIETQKILLKRFCKENNIFPTIFYVDDGFSGLNFNRPGFQKLLNDIDRGVVCTVITKDLSRLGRDYIQTGYYIDMYFKERNVRYIAVNDHVDTGQGDNDIAPFKNILNDMYAHDLSNKIKSAKRQRALKGLYISGQAPYGYMPDAENGNHLVIDYEAALQVKRIFSLAAEGKTLREIAAEMTSEHIITPGAYKAMHGDTRFERFKKQDEWSYATISQILRDQAYIGHMVNHKSEVKNYKTKHCQMVPIEDRIMVENTHDPIISIELFDRAQAILASRAKPHRYAFENVLEELVICGECGQNMTQATKKRKNGMRYLLRCSNHFTHPDQCRHNHAIYYDELVDFVWNDLQAHLCSVGNLPLDTNSLTRGLVLQWIEYIEIGKAPFDLDQSRNQVVIHYKDTERRPRRKKKRYLMPWEM